MAIEVLFFAGAREAAGTAATTIDVDRPLSAASLLDRLCERYPALVPHRQSLRVAVNQSYAELDQEVGDGDEVALIPPVCGG